METVTYLNTWLNYYVNLFGWLYVGNSELQLNYYSQSCPKAEEIIKQEVTNLYNKHGNTAVSWIRNLFHDCIVQVLIDRVIYFVPLTTYVP